MLPSPLLRQQQATLLALPVLRGVCSKYYFQVHHHGFYYNATPEATPKRPMARPPTPKSPATAADPRSTISPARRHDPPRWGRAGPTGTCTPMWAPPEGETRGGTEGPRQPRGASVGLFLRPNGNLEIRTWWPDSNVQAAAGSVP